MLLTNFLLPDILKVQVQECGCVYVFIQGMFSTGVGVCQNISACLKLNSVGQIKLTKGHL